VVGKFRWLTGFVMEDAQTDRLLDLLISMDETPDVRMLTRELLYLVEMLA
jgi:hypothetical protein